jgi:hypothetical protein
MDPKFQATLRTFVPFVILAFVVCGGGGLYCPMPASATDTQHSQQTSHHSSSSQTTGDCPDQLTTSAENFENEDASFEVLSVAAFTWLNDIPSFGLFTFLGIERTPHSTTYPLLFLLFSVFLN